MATIRVTVWDENPPHVDKAIYPTSIRGAVADGLAALNDGALEIRTRTSTSQSRAAAWNACARPMCLSGGGTFGTAR
jgi:trehalose utilization protein